MLLLCIIPVTHDDVETLSAWLIRVTVTVTQKAICFHVTLNKLLKNSRVAEGFENLMDWTAFYLFTKINWTNIGARAWKSNYTPLNSGRYV